MDDSGRRGAAATTAAAPVTRGGAPDAADFAAPDGGGGRYSLSPPTRDHRGQAELILRETGMFRDDEVAVALEVLDAFIAAPERDYHAVGAFTPGGSLLGFIIYGPTPCTLGTWDLYWIAVHPDAQGLGVGSTLTKEMERRLARTNARLVLIETSSRPAYEPTRAFYLRRGYEEAARVKDFYEPGDDRVIFAKRMQPAAEESAASAGRGDAPSVDPTPGAESHG